jgi:hypothetical protein
MRAEEGAALLMVMTQPTTFAWAAALLEYSPMDRSPGCSAAVAWSGTKSHSKTSLNR